jgi:uncharacterized protein (DUF1800 family)
MKRPLFILMLGALLATAGAQATALTPEQQAVHVLNRVAFGPAPGDIDRVTRGGVRNYLEAQLNPATLAYPAPLEARLRALETTNRSAGDVLADFVELRKEARDEGEAAKQKRRAGVAHIALETAEARVLRAIDSPRQLEEVMVDFWFNHFNVFSGKGVDRALIASYERDAIRPHVFGSFRDLLGATAKHPAMLYYLDNYLSTGAGPTVGFGARLLARRAPNAAKAHGLNENYARELMELHTLGVDGGYSQKDVTELARMLTGWTYDQRALVRNNQGFKFDASRHDGGEKNWLGRTVTEHGQGEGEMALDVLARHPATAHRIGYKLAQYFVRDDPPPALVERLARSFQDTKGDIRSVLRTLFASEEFMDPSNVGAKFKTPYQFVISAARASAVPVESIAPLLGTMNQLGMPLYGCQTPDGYKNTQDAWLNTDALARRITFATALAAGRLQLSGARVALATSTSNGGQAAAPMTLTTPRPAPATMAASVPDAAPLAAAQLDPLRLQATLGESISQRTRLALANHPEPLRAAMLLGGPDFMQR